MRAKRSLPEAPPNRQEGVVGSQHRRVFRTRRQVRALQMAGDLALPKRQGFFNGRQCVRLLGQHHLARDRFHVGVHQIDLHAETPQQPLQERRALERGLSAADEHELAGEPPGALFRDLLNGIGAVGGPFSFADLLLDFVQRQQRQREPPVPRQRALDRIHHLVQRYVGNLGELSRKQLQNVARRRTKVLAHGKKGAGKVFGDKQVG